MEKLEKELETKLGKLEDLKKGHYNNQVITLIPGTYKPKVLK